MYFTYTKPVDGSAALFKFAFLLASKCLVLMALSLKILVVPSLLMIVVPSGLLGAFAMPLLTLNL